MTRIERAVPSDLPAIEALLTSVGLPLDGVAAAFDSGIVARDGDLIVGCAALEVSAGAALLRSVAVVPERRGEGIGSESVRAAEAMALDLGVTELYLLTETAGSWFAGLGWTPVDRARVPPGIGSSVEFTRACPTTAACLRLDLDQRRALRP